MSKFLIGDKIKIVKATWNTYWYADKIGEVFTITGYSYPFQGYTVNNGGGVSSIAYGDCVKVEEFDLKTMPWWIKVENEEQSKAVQEWLFEQGVSWCSSDFLVKNKDFKYLTNFTIDQIEQDGFIWMTLPNEYLHTPDKEIKLFFSLKVDKVEFPSVKSEQEIQLEKLKEKIEELNKQAILLEKVIKEEKYNGN